MKIPPVLTSEPTTGKAHSREHSDDDVHRTTYPYSCVSGEAKACDIEESSGQWTEDG